MKQQATAPLTARLVAAGLAFASAIVLVWSSFTRTWAVPANPADASGYGLRDVSRCDTTTEWVSDTEAPIEHVECETRATTRIPGVGKAFGYFGIAASWGIWVGALALCLAAALMLAGRFIVRPIAPTTVALLALAVGLVSGCVFTALNPGRGEFRVGTGFWIFGVGEIVGIAATILVARVRPSEPDWDDPQAVDEDNWNRPDDAV